MYEYRANVCRVIDGDTVVVDIDLGFGVWLRAQRIRLVGIDAPKSRTLEGAAATQALESKIQVPQGITLRTQKDTRGKYGRWLGVIIADQVNVNEWMLHEGLVEKYAG